MIEKLIKRIDWHLDRAKIPYMIIGGQAVLLYGTPRLTRDIDITLGIDTDKFKLIEKICNKLGLKILPKAPKDFAEDTKVLPAEEAKLRIRVDFSFSFYDLSLLGGMGLFFPFSWSSCVLCPLEF